MNHLRLFLLIASFLIINIFNISSQEEKSKIESMTRDEILQMSTDQLLALPLEDLMALANKLGVSIDELLKMQTSVASHTELTQRETPGIISIITSEEIRNSGARDLTDVLKLVPGIDFEYDVDGVVGIGFRGSWVHEGKALILIDGQMMNDLVYYNTPFGNHFDVSQIKKIEIVRGPGSAMYGGNAELCVISITTKNGEDLKGVAATATYGQLPQSLGRLNGSLMAGTKVGKWDIALKTFFAEANRSNGKYITNPDSGNKAFIQDFAINGSKIQTQNVNFSLRRQDLSFQFIYDNYNTQALADTSLTFLKFKNITSSLKYNFKLSDKVSLVPLLSYQYSQPYNDTLLSSRSYVVQRYKIGASLNYNISENLNMNCGGEYYTDMGQITDLTLGSHNLNVKNTSLYMQLLWKIKHFNIIAGGRVENNNAYGSAFVPRFGITRVIKRLHFKLLASEAFRSPSIGNIDVSNNLKVEKTLVVEAEAGFKINSNMFVTGNIYDISITNPIIYFDNGNLAATPGTDWGYTNASKQGSNGFELEYRYKYTWGFSTINYSFYTEKWKSAPDYYTAAGYPNVVLGMPQSKFTILNSIKLSEKIDVTPSMIYCSKRYGYIQDAEWNTAIKEYPSSIIVNLNLSFSNILAKGLNLDLGIFNILNDKSALIQPYNGGYPPYPGREREFVIRLNYNFRMEK
jgi:outer membrane cobalamin receptor